MNQREEGAGPLSLGGIGQSDATLVQHLAKPIADPPQVGAVGLSRAVECSQEVPIGKMAEHMVDSAMGLGSEVGTSHLVQQVPALQQPGSQHAADLRWGGCRPERPSEGSQGPYQVGSLQGFRENSCQVQQWLRILGLWKHHPFSASNFMWCSPHVPASTSPLP